MNWQEHVKKSLDHARDAMVLQIPFQGNGEDAKTLIDDIYSIISYLEVLKENLILEDIVKDS